MDNKWIPNGDTHAHTHAAVVNASPWASYKKGSCKKWGKKEKISTSAVHMLGSVLLKTVLLNG